MSDLINSIIAQQRSLSQLQHLTGRTLAPEVGIVADRNDPLSLGRVRCTTASKGGKYQTGWLMRLVPSPDLSFPVPAVGDTVAIAYFDGDPHKGCYEVLQNDLNPAGDIDAFSFKVAGTTISIDPDGNVSILSAGDLNIDAERTHIQCSEMSLTGASTFTINGKEVATIDAIDDAGFKLVSKGWS